MTKVRTGVRPDEISQSARHVLFVEGIQDSLDPPVLRCLLRDIITVKPMGPSFNIRSAAEALHPYYPDHYFLIDRDHHDLKTVENSWRNFPDPETNNLLIWRRRELENYFIDPKYAAKSEYCDCSIKDLQKCILETARKRIFLDAANLVIIQIRERLKEKWIEIFTKIEEFENKESALQKLINSPDFRTKKSSVPQILRKDNIAQRFEKEIKDLFGGQDELSFGQGSWLEMVKGKKVLPTVVNECFEVKDAKGQRLQGGKAVVETAKDLLRLELPEQPPDFQELHALLENIIRGS